MNLHLTVDSYFEYFLTVFAWIIGNNIWDLMVDSGLFAAPFIAHIVGAFLKVREQGDDEGNKGQLLTAWLENKIYLSIIIMLGCCVPLFNVSFSTLKFDTERMKVCKTTVLKPEQTGLGNLRTELNGQTAKLPLWWAFTYAASKGLTHGAIASIPCKPDLRQIRFEVQNTQIKDPFLRKEVNDFVQECFIPARTYLKNFGTIRNLDDASAQDLAWIGSQILLGNPNLYPKIRAKTPNPFFPWDPTRDAVLPRELGGGFPYCDVWWKDGTNGLRARLLNQIEPSTWQKIRSVFQSQQGYEEGILKGLLAQQDIRVTPKTRGYDSVRSLETAESSDRHGILATSAKKVVGLFGSTVGNGITAPAFDVLKQTLPWVQSLMLFALAIATPLLIIFSGYSVKAMMAITFGFFGIFFLSFWWEIAYWLDSSLYQALYGHLGGNGNIIDDVAEFFREGDEHASMNMVLNSMYLIIPALWIGFLSWAGIKVGDGLNKAIGDGAGSARKGTQEGQNKVSNKAGV